VKAENGWKNEEERVDSTNLRYKYGKIEN